MILVPNSLKLSVDSDLILGVLDLPLLNLLEVLSVQSSLLLRQVAHVDVESSLAHRTGAYSLLFAAIHIHDRRLDISWQLVVKLAASLRPHPQLFEPLILHALHDMDLLVDLIGK